MDPEGRGEAEEDPRVGRVLGGVYRLTERIGVGGMGVVYAARHEQLGRGFAVKVLTRDEAPSDSALERFRQEAVQASQIDHDHIVDVVHFDATDEGEPYLVMELLRGESLAERITRDGPLPRDRALTIAFQVGDALAAAHERGIVHRDLKPENVFLVDKGGRDHAKVLDFGISKMHAAADDDVRLTKTGQIVGTPLYMSPEQARGETDRVDARADVYALGCLLYEMLTGTPPFDGANHYQILWKHGQEAPEPPSTRTPSAGIDRALEAAILRALEKDPDRRYPSMRAFLAALPAPEHVASGTTTLPPAPSPPYGPRKFATELAAIAMLGVALVAVALAVRAAREGGPAATTTPTSDRAASDDATADGARTPPTPGPTAEASARSAGAEADAPTAAPDAGAPEGPPAASSPRSVPVRFDSMPRGARVSAGGRALGRTPLQAMLAASGEPLDVRFELEGFEPRRVTVVPGRDHTVEARLRRSADPPTPPPPDMPPIKRQL